MAAVQDMWSSLATKAPAVSHLLSSATVEIVLIVTILFVLAPLARFLLRLIQSSASSSYSEDSSFTSDSSKIPLHTGLLSVSKLPNLAGAVPWVGHLLGLQNDSARYVNRLLASTAAPIFTINIPFKRIIVANTSMDRSLSRHTSETGLAQILAYVGPRVFGLGAKTIRVILDADPRPQHKVEFGGIENLKALSERSGTFVWDQMNQMPAHSEVDLAHWMFGMTVSATASAVWGVENPWRMDREFAEEFM